MIDFRIAFLALMVVHDSIFKVLLSAMMYILILQTSPIGNRMKSCTYERVPVRLPGLLHHRSTDEDQYSWYT